MTVHSDHAKPTARTLLLGTGDDTAGLARALSKHNALDHAESDLTRLTPEGRQAACEALASVAANTIELDVGDVLISAWRTDEHLQEAARATIAKPGSEQVVQLASHEIAWTYLPKVDLIIDNIRVHTFEFELTAGFDLEVLAAIIRDGKLVGLRSGGVTISLALSMAAAGGDIELIRGEHEVDVHLIIHLGDGVPLLSTESSTPAPPTSELSHAAD